MRDPSEFARVDELYALYRARLEAGEQLDFESFCRAHPDFAAQLARVHADRELLSEFLGRMPKSGRSLFHGQWTDRSPHSGLPVDEGTVIDDFRLTRKIAEGGMGQVWAATQLSLNREVALKLMLPGRIAEKSIKFFEREGRAGGRLQHAGIVSIYGVGRSAGVHYIAQELVAGERTLADSLAELRSDSDLSPAYYSHVARFFAEASEALQSAHDAGVIHRDIKPRNILITPTDQPKITDFGLADITDEASISQTGEIAGTYAYMSPEQIGGKRAELDERTDIFSLGVVLYEALSLVRPFQGDTSQQIASKILFEDPRPLRSVRSRIPRDLAVICEKALEKNPRARYRSMADLACDLRRFLRNEPIHAKPAGHFRRLHKWALRHPAMATGFGLGGFALIVITSLLVSSVRMATREGKRAEEVLSLSALRDLVRLNEAAENELWPAFPERIHDLREWLGEARQLLEKLPEFEAKRSELRGRARAPTKEELEIDRREHPRAPALAAASAALAELEQHQARLMQRVDTEATLSRTDARTLDELPERIALAEERCAELQADISEPWRWHFDDVSDEWWHGELNELVEGLRVLAARQGGRAGTGDDHERWSIPRRLDFALSVREQTVEGETARELWAAAIANIADDVENPLYGGLEIAPQLGLIPIGTAPNPSSGLWEFGHPQTGVVPKRDAHGVLGISEETGLVFVLLPGGPVKVGAQKTDPGEANFDALAEPNEMPVRDVTLAPFFISKYEMTQAQWQRFTGETPSAYSPASHSENVGSMLHPVETVSWPEVASVFKKLSLALPTELQWEYAARGGQSVPWWSEAELGLRRFANIADRSAAEAGAGGSEFEEWSDGYAVHSPVHGFEPNPFGLHGMIGNVWEWCRGPWRVDLLDRRTERSRLRPMRGGAHNDSARVIRLAHRSRADPETKSHVLGCRPIAPVATD